MRSTRDTVRHDTRMSGLVRRYHTWPTLTQQSVGEHSWQVLRIYTEIFGAPPPEVTVAILYHDSPELVTGDPPFPIKMENPDLAEIYHRLDRETLRSMLGYDLAELDEATRRRVKICDLMEMWEFGLHECLMGNSYAHMIIDDTSTVIAILGSACSEADAVLIKTHMIVRADRTERITHE